MLAIPLATQAAANVSAPSDDAIHRMLVTRVDVQKRATGVVVGILDAQGRHVIAYGHTALDGKHSVDGRTVFDIGSVTKVFTALLLSEMVQQGEVALDDPVQKFLPQARLTLPRQANRQITLVDLATHTSGLPLRPSNLTSKDPDNKYAGYSIEGLYQFLSNFQLTRDIGSTYEYSNVGYGLVGQALSQRAGRSYAELIESRITGPLGLRDTRLDLNASMKRLLATGYNDQLIRVPHWDFGALESAGALRSTADDLLALLAAFRGLKDAALTSALDAMLRTRRPGGMQPATEIALAWNIFSDGAHEIAWKNGSVGGFRTFIGYDMNAGIGIVALANAQTPGGVDDIGLHLLDEKVPVDLQAPKVHHAIAIDPVVLERYVGRYRFSATDILTVTREDSHLFGQEPGDDRFELLAEDDRNFFLKIIDAQLTFESSGDAPSKAVIWHQGGTDQRGERIE